jgi:hypothetical protein
MLLVAGGKASPVFELTEAALNDIATLVEVLVEPDRAPTRTATTEPVALLVTTLRDGVRDPAGTQHLPVSATAVALVAQHVIGSGSWPTAARARDPQPGHELGEQDGVVDVAGVTNNTNGRPTPSTRAWTLLVNPPRERPIPCSSDSTTTGANR